MIYFIRHGATDWNDNISPEGIPAPKCQGTADIPINQRGKKQAEEVYSLLKDINFDRVICSPLLRARQTANIIYKGSTPIEIDNRLIERDFGDFEGLTRSQFDFLGFWNRTTSSKYTTGESIEQVEKRIFSLLNELKKTPKQNILLVSHGGLGCILVSYFKGIPTDGNYITYEIPNGKPLILEFKNID